MNASLPSMSADHFALDASIPPALPRGPGRRPLQRPLECLPDVHLSRDVLHCGYRLPEHQGQVQPSSLLITQHLGLTITFSLQITKLKIDHNPFAKGFRDEGTNKKRFVLKLVVINALLSFVIKSVASADVQPNTQPALRKERRFQTMIPNRTAHQVTAFFFKSLCPSFSLSDHLSSFRFLSVVLRQL